MKTKLMMIVAATLTSTSAFADIQLDYTRSNQTVAYPIAHSCTIEGALVTSSATGRLIDFPYSTTKAVTWTKAVPNSVVLESLVTEAALHTLINSPVMSIIAGGPTETYTFTNAKNETKTLLNTYAGFKTLYNPSTAAKKIEAFMAKNCKQTSNSI